MLLETSKRLFDQLLLAKTSIVFCESCTAGLAAASLGRFPGVSKVLAGSLVVYQTTTKHDWLQIPSDLLDDPQLGPVSEPVTQALAAATLARTPSAGIAVAITGHLGPTASIADYDSQRLTKLAGSRSDTENPIGDGTVFVAIARRGHQEVVCQRFALQAPSPRSTDDHDARGVRQIEATLLAYNMVAGTLRVP